MICDLQWAMINDLSEPYLALRTCLDIFDLNFQFEVSQMYKWEMKVLMGFRYSDWNLLVWHLVKFNFHLHNQYLSADNSIFLIIPSSSGKHFFCVSFQSMKHFSVCHSRVWLATRRQITVGLLDQFWKRRSSYGKAKLAIGWIFSLMKNLSWLRKGSTLNFFH